METDIDRRQRQPLPPARGSLHRHWIGLKTLACRECGLTIRYWAVMLAPPAVTTLLYFAVFGEILGNRIGPLGGVDYIHYVAPGLIVLWVIPCAYSHTAFWLLSARVLRFAEEVLVSPLPDWVMMLGYVSGGTVRGLLTGAIASLIALLFAALHVKSPFMALAALLLSALVSSLAGFIAGLFAKSFEQAAFVQGAILIPLMYLGGVFTPVSMLPHWAQRASLANPMLYAVNAFRYGLLGVSDVPAELALAMMSATAVALFFFAVKLMRRGAVFRH